MPFRYIRLYKIKYTTKSEEIIITENTLEFWRANSKALSGHEVAREPGFEQPRSNVYTTAES